MTARCSCLANENVNRMTVSLYDLISIVLLYILEFINDIIDLEDAHKLIIGCVILILKLYIEYRNRQK